LATTQKSEESDFEFHFVRETPSPSPPPPPKPPSTIPSVEDEPTDELLNLKSPVEMKRKSVTSFA
jgi:hypothetical protein